MARQFDAFRKKVDATLREEGESATTTSDVAVPDTPMFGGHRVFPVPTDTFVKARLGKKKYAKWFDYVGESPNGEEIRSFGLKNPKAPIILQDERSGAMMYLRYGR